MHWYYPLVKGTWALLKGCFWRPTASAEHRESLLRLKGGGGWRGKEQGMIIMLAEHLVGPVTESGFIPLLP